MQGLLSAPLQAMCNYYALPKQMTKFTSDQDVFKGTRIVSTAAWLTVCVCCADKIAECAEDFHEFQMHMDQVSSRFNALCKLQVRSQPLAEW